MESVLGLIRNEKLVPDAENINFLLLASDALQDLLVHVEKSDEMDISDHVTTLSSITDPPKPLSTAPPEKAQGKPKPVAPSAPAETRTSIPETSLRVHVELLDSLMTLAGELVLGRNQLLQSLSRKDLDTSEAVGKRIDHITSELQEAIMRTRMQPIGRISLKAFHEAGQVNIEIEDDGQGLDGEKLATEAVEKGFITQEQLAALSENEKIQLIFLPGFSMAHKVTDLSGRGVGMDVVKTNLDRLGGQIDLNTEIGKGTTVRIKVPLTLAIIPSQIILTENERYAVPQINLVELIRLPANQVQKRVEIVGDAEVVRLRSRLLPLLRLSDVLGIGRTYADPDSEKARADRRKRIADRRSRKSPLFGSLDEDWTADGNGDAENPNDPQRSDSDRRYRVASGLNIAVVSSGDMKYGLVVDGKVALILDVMELAQLSELSSVHESTRAKELAKEKAAALKVGKDRQSLLVFRNGHDEQFAVPLNQVLRIEKISAADVEVMGGRKVMQYRDGNLLLFTMDQVAAIKPLEEKNHLLVLVFMLAGREVGLLATGPVDAIEVTAKPDEKALKQPGIMGSVVIDGQTTLLVDVFDIIATLNPDWFTENQETEKTPAAAAKILIAEDSNFFRDQVKGFIEDEGYAVIEAEDGLAAWNLLQEQGDTISLVVTDLEMPNLDGLGLAKKIKSDERYMHLPVIALTTLAEDDDIARGREVGIDDYQIKLDREKLIESIDRFMRDI